MVETGKQSRYQRDNDNEGKYHKKSGSNKDYSADGELVVYRILCPDGVIGSVIGKSGNVINTLRQETHARIKAGSTLLWDLTVLGWEVNYKEEFVPTDEGSYTIIVQKGKKMGPNEAPIRNSFRNNEPGKMAMLGVARRRNLLNDDVLIALAEKSWDILDISGSEVSDFGLAKVAELCRHLRAIDISGYSMIGTTNAA